MLSPADAALAERDPTLPGLATLFAPQTLAERLKAALPGWPNGTLRADYVRYKPGTNCLVGYRLKTARQEHLLYATTYGPGAEGKLAKARQEQATQQPHGPVGLVLDDLATVVHFFPHDRKLKGLAEVMNPTTRPRLLSKLMPDRPDLWAAELACLRYKPERRYVGQMVTTAGPQALLKLYTAADFPHIKQVSRTFGKNGPLHFITRLGRSNGKQLLALEWLPGLPLDALLPDPDFDLSRVRLVGSTLASMHAQVSYHLPIRSHTAEAAALQALKPDIAALCSAMAARLPDLINQLTLRLLRATAGMVPTHGDFSADQVLVQGQHITFLDFDRAASGDPATDLGSFLAKLEYDVLLERLEADRAAAIKQEFLAGYRQATKRGLPSRLNLYTAVRLLHLAPQPFRTRVAGWPKIIAAILARLEEMINDDD